MRPTPDVRGAIFLRISGHYRPIAASKLVNRVTLPEKVDEIPPSHDCHQTARTRASTPLPKYHYSTLLSRRCVNRFTLLKTCNLCRISGLLIDALHEPWSGLITPFRRRHGESSQHASDSCLGPPFDHHVGEGQQPGHDGEAECRRGATRSFDYGSGDAQKRKWNLYP
jgi:hypothetical protein